MANCKPEQEARESPASLLSEGWVMALSMEARANFMTATRRFLIIMNSPLNILLVHAHWWMNLGNRKFSERSMGVAAHQRGWCCSSPGTAGVKGRQDRLLDSVWKPSHTLYEPSCVLPSTPSILASAPVTDGWAGFNLVKMGCTGEYLAVGWAGQWERCIKWNFKEEGKQEKEVRQWGVTHCGSKGFWLGVSQSSHMQAQTSGNKTTQQYGPFSITYGLLVKSQPSKDPDLLTVLFIP